jgi:Family of unknown function (DUF6476)
MMDQGMAGSKQEADNGGAPGATDVVPAQFSDAQMRLLKMAVTGMGVILVAGILALIGRVAYLAQRNNAPAATGLTSSQKLVTGARVELPAGAVLKSSTLSGDHLVVSYSDAGGDGVIIADLTTGQTISRIRIERAK